jgi:hypothetical protein
MIVGLLLVLFGWGPLLLIGFLASIGALHDPDPNPIGPGLLFFVTSWPAIICIALGIIKGRRGSHSTHGEHPTTPGAARVTAYPLTDEQAAYVAHWSFGGAFGFFYFAYMGVPGAFSQHLVDNVLWTRMVAHARQWAWEAGAWQDFEAFRQRSERAERLAKPIIAVCVVALAVVLFGF